MSGKADNYYDLALVDPDYGIGENWKKDRHSGFYKHNTSYKNKEIPNANYFKELFRISKNQIIWGGNYYTDYLPARNSWIVWDKNRNWKTQHMAEGELAWTSFNIPLRIIRLLWNGHCVCEPRYGKHPHEKPVKLYKWTLKNYAKPGDNIIDTHGGSGSLMIACHDLDFNLDWIEIERIYYNDAINRLKKYKTQLIIPYT